MWQISVPYIGPFWTVRFTDCPRVAAAYFISGRAIVRLVGGGE
jgi:hypothetical protein